MIGRYIHGWRVFWETLMSQRRKKHGKGTRPWIPAIYFSLCARWIVDGQARRGRPPNNRFWYWLSERVGSYRWRQDFRSRQ